MPDLELMKGSLDFQKNIRHVSFWIRKKYNALDFEIKSFRQAKIRMEKNITRWILN